MVGIKRALSMTRLLTLTGAGGSGKTRLALEVARDLVGAYPNGVWLVRLAPLSEETLIPQEVAQALGVSERPDHPLTETLVEFLRPQVALVVMDNCEHLVEAAARLVDTFLDNCPRLRILATSREPLGTAGELNWSISPLSTPSMQRALSAEQLIGYEATRLFVQRASSKRPNFSLSPENAQAVANICRRLDGIPLAIELAAARVGALSAEQISQRLEDSLKLLTGGSRTQTLRQQTLRGTQDWSYDLLAEREQMLFRRLSVFAGGWTLEAAEAVGKGGGIEAGDVLDLLSRLVDKSLVVAEATTEGKLRYRMLEPVRQYAQEKLEEGAEGEAVGRHATFFLALAEEVEPQVEGPQQVVWMDRLEEEHDNIRAALSWSLERGEDAELGLRMGAALGEFWYLRGYFSEARRWLEEALAKSGGTPTAARARALQRVSLLAFLQGDLDRAEEASEEGLRSEGVELFRTGGGDSTAAELQRVLAIVVGTRGELEQETRLLEESLALSREAGSLRGMAHSLFFLGAAWRARGDYERATRHFEEALTMFRETGEQSTIATVLTHLGFTYLLQGDLERATTTSEEAAAMLREGRVLLHLAFAIKTLGWAALARGDHENARILFGESVGYYREVGDGLGPLENMEGLACVAEARGEAERAARLFGACEALREVIGAPSEPGDSVLHEPYLTAARYRLDEAAWETAWAEGRAMGLEEVIEYALSDEELPASSTSVQENSPVGTPPATLTRREAEISALVAQGLTNRQIASELSISEHTAATHVARILKKLGLQSRAQIGSWLAERPTTYPN
jgi:non-specific serine/threonine protein kinase